MREGTRGDQVIAAAVDPDGSGADRQARFQPARPVTDGAMLGVPSAHIGREDVLGFIVRLRRGQAHLVVRRAVQQLPGGREQQDRGNETR